MKNLAGLLIMAILVISCLSEEEEFSGFTASQVERLISADSLKSWQIASVTTGGELMPPGGADSCLYRYRYNFTSFIGNDSITVYLRNDPGYTCQADTAIFFWTTLFEEGNEDIAVVRPKLIVGTDSGNIVTRVTVLTDSQMEWQLLREDDEETPRDPEQLIRFVRAND